MEGLVSSTTGPVVHSHYKRIFHQFRVDGPSLILCSTRYFKGDVKELLQTPIEGVPYERVPSKLGLSGFSGLERVVNVVFVKI